MFCGAGDRRLRTKASCRWRPRGCLIPTPAARGRACCPSCCVGRIVDGSETWSFVSAWERAHRSLSVVAPYSCQKHPRRAPSPPLFTPTPTPLDVMRRVLDKPRLQRATRLGYEGPAAFAAADATPPSRAGRGRPGPRASLHGQPAPPPPRCVARRGWTAATEWTQSGPVVICVVFPGAPPQSRRACMHAISRRSLAHARRARNTHAFGHLVEHGNEEAHLERRAVPQQRVQDRRPLALVLCEEPAGFWRDGATWANGAAAGPA